LSKAVWVDDNHIVGEMSDAEFMSKIREEAVRRNNDTKKYGRDGHFVVYSEEASYKGIPYIVKVCRYFQIGVPLNEIKGMNHLGKWVWLECVPESEPIRNLMSSLPYPVGDSEWLWQDTLHIHNRGQTLRQMVDEMHQCARSDIDELDVLMKRTEDFMQEITGILLKIRQMQTEFQQKENANILPKIGGEKIISIPESEFIKWSNDNDPDRKNVPKAKMWQDMNRLAIRYGVDFGDI